MSTFIACSKSSHYCYTTFLTKTATPCLQAVRIGVLARRPGSILVRFVVDRVALGQICLQYLFSPVSMIPPMLPIDLLFFFFFLRDSPSVVHGLLIHEVTGHTHNDAPQSVGLLWTSDQPVAETSTWQHTHTHNRQTSMHPVGFEPTISAGERPQTYALDRAGAGTYIHILPTPNNFSN